MNYVFDIFKGIAIGIANVIPGFSGGTMAVILRCYEKLINAFSDLTKKPFKVLKELWAILVGVVLGIILASFTIMLSLEKYPIQTIMFFVGLIIGSIPTIVSNIKKADESKQQKFRLRIVDLVSLVTCVSTMVILPLLNNGEDVTDFNFITCSVVFVMGAICAGAMIIPGISGSLILMVFGYYIFILGNVNEVLSKMIHFDFNGIGNEIIILGLFGVGAVLGLLGISKLIKLLLRKWPKTVYSAILGLLLASPFSIIYATIQDYKAIIDWTSPWLYIIGVIMLIIGGGIALSMSILDEKNNKEKEEPNV